jgi:hypothetical protein
LGLFSSIPVCGGVRGGVGASRHPPRNSSMTPGRIPIPHQAHLEAYGPTVPHLAMASGVAAPVVLSFPALNSPRHRNRGSEAREVCDDFKPRMFVAL